MKVYFNHKRELVETIVRFGFTDDIFRSIDFADVSGVELRDAEPDPNEGCPMAPEGAVAAHNLANGGVALGRCR